MPRFAIAGFHHETNSFAPTRADLAEFEMADSWPGLLVGAEVIDGTRGMNLPTAGFAMAASRHPTVELIPILWCAAEPSGPVTDRAFETITSRILGGIRHAGALDGIYLDLHGAMVSDSIDDGEGALLARIRRRVGHGIPIVASLDLHANLTREMVDLADQLCIFRTYPHLDMAETGARAFAALLRMIGGTRRACAFRQAPYLIPLHAQHTGTEPGRRLYDRIGGHRHSVELALGFTASDIADTGPALVAYASDAEEAARTADSLFADLLRAETQFDCRLFSPEDAVSHALSLEADRPIVIADVQDNPGAGGTSDTTGLLAALVAAGARGALVGLMHDPEIAALAHRLGEGASFEAALGGKSGLPGVAPYSGRFRVAALRDGPMRYTGDMYAGGTATLGPTAALRIVDADADVQVVVTSIRNQCLDRAHFAHIGLDPARARILCVKSTAHFRADFEPIAAAVLPTAAPGAFPCRLEEIAYRKLRAGVRRGPGGPVPAGEVAQ